MKKLFTLVAVALATASSTFAQISVQTESGDLSVRFMGRTNIDFGTYLTDEDEVGGGNDNQRCGLMLNDTRLGALASFDEKWQAKIEVSFANKAIAFKDVWVSYKPNTSSTLSFGHFMLPFGAKILGLAYKFVEDASADNTFSPARRMGFTYGYVSDPFLFTAGIFSDNTADTKTLNSGMSVGAKAIFRPWVEDGSVLHFGVAPLYTKPKKDEGVSFKCTVPCTIESNVLGSYAANAENYWRFEAEAIFIKGKFYAEAHNITTIVNIPENKETRTEAKSEVLNGVYGQISYLIKGEKQNYNKKTGLAQAASAKSLEVLARVSNSKLVDYSTTDITIGANYFYNKNVNVKLNYIHAISSPKGYDSVNHDMIQTRIQFSF